jgi:hypothetical protein
MSGMWKRGMDELVRHRQPKGPATDRLTLNNRLGTDAETWQARFLKLASGRFLGRFFAAQRERQRGVAERLGVRHLVNLAACPAR